MLSNREIPDQIDRKRKVILAFAASVCPKGAFVFILRIISLPMNDI